MGPAIAGSDGGEGVVLLRAQGPQVPDGAADEQGDGGRVLEGHGQGQGHLQGQGPRRHEEDARLLHREGAQGREVRVGHARVPPRRRRPRQQDRVLQERVGAVQGVQEEPCGGSFVGAGVVGRTEGRRGDGGDGFLGRSSPSAPRPVRRAMCLLRPSGARDLLLPQRAGGGPVLQQPDSDGRSPRRRLHHGRPPILVAVPGELRAVRARRGPEPGAAPREHRVPARAACCGRDGAVQQAGRAGEAERVAGHRPHHLRHEPRDLFVLRRPEVRPRARALGLLADRLSSSTHAPLARPWRGDPLITTTSAFTGGCSISVNKPASERSSQLVVSFIV